MNIHNLHKHLLIALLAAGSAILLVSCGNERQTEEEIDNSGLMTQEADSLIMIESVGGKKKYRFYAPRMETFEYAKEPYREFPEGISVVTFADSTGAIESTLVANYAIEFIKQELWEAKGNVVATNSEGQKLETQQLFWNRRTKKIYSNIDSKVSQGEDVIVGVGFVSDEQFKDWEFRRPRGEIMVEVDPENTDGSQGSGSQSGGRSSSGTGGQTSSAPRPSANTQETRPTAARPSGLVGSPSARRPAGNDPALEQKFRDDDNLRPAGVKLIEHQAIKISDEMQMQPMEARPLQQAGNAEAEKSE